MTIHELYKKNAYGFDSYNAWCRHFEALFASYTLECVEFGEEWLRRWEAVGVLLEQPAVVEVWIRPDKTAGWWVALEETHADGTHPTVADCLQYCDIAEKNDEAQRVPHQKRRVVLLDGTVVKEWNANETP